LIDPKKLPVYQQKSKILDVIEKNQVIIVESPTGSGKTTQLPLILYEAGYAANGMIGVTQPRRIATLSVCDYMAHQLGTTVPGLVGYKMRFHDMTSKETLLKIMTDGTLLQEIKTDYLLSKYSCIIIDEAHERSLNIDFILGLLKRILEERDDFKVIISSATINTSIFSEYFDGATVVHIDSIMFPVGILYDPITSGKNNYDDLIFKINDIISRIITEKRKGDILVFLSGEKQIKDCMKMLNASPLRRKMVILPLYGRLSKEEQERVFIKTPWGKIKIVISTNIAETSVTIDGITTVIDSGLAKINSYNPRTYTSSLLETQISKASSNQRKGRAGRTQEGNCYRLYARNDFETRELFTKEEIYRTDLSEVVLRMAELGITNFDSFDFISSPGKQGIAGAVDTLKLLEAINDDNTLTKIGEMMVKFPLSPRLSRIIAEAVYKYPEVLEETLIAATFLSTNSPFILPQGEEFEARKAHHSLRTVEGDFVSYLKIFRKFEAAEKKEEFCKTYYLDIKVMNELVNIKTQLEDIVREDIGVPVLSGGKTFDYLYAVCKGLIQFVCVKSGKGIYRSLTADKIHIHPGSVMFKENPQFIVAGELVRTSKMFAHSVSPLRKEWLKIISPTLADRLLRKEIPGRVGQRDRQTSNTVKIGDYLFKIENMKGKKKKIAILYWNKLQDIYKKTEFKNIFVPSGIIGKIVYNNFELLEGEKIKTIIRIVPFIDPEKNYLKNIPVKGNMNSYSALSRLIQNINYILYITPVKKKAKELGFISLNTDNKGNYWFKVSKGFDNALTTSLGSLENLMDEIPQESNPDNIDKINKTFRKLNFILDKQYYTDL
jgi:RNA helicase HrpA